MRSGTRIVLVALAAGVLGAALGFAIHGPGPLLRTEWGQRAVQSAYDAVSPPAPEGMAVASRDERIPAISLPGLDGRRIDLPAQFAGRPLLVNVWASWCGPCIKEMPELERYAREQAANGTQVLGIALDDGEAVRTFLQRVPVSYPIALDTPGPRDAGVRLGNRRGVLPYSVLVSADGRLLKQHLGPFEAGQIEDWARQP
jgi:thiol-disulfide isomerase/thioredoxin